MISLYVLELGDAGDTKFQISVYVAGPQVLRHTESFLLSGETLFASR